ncbi:hypothetical protein T8K17_11355 [Thalassobaculum sp. OXR-137]|uniref:hypothetical protein n=1 Tax=Thalassobaculum sp. OXR-137 TaxID=3100173 RepID=UPI002AC9E00F|nr:hypothetical protein [Thalassobaculum sp. OXR-137]WPZ36731.1 hypothetical protein T8K17_11355 [Thalassobaculum sp. OXR-137]
MGQKPWEKKPKSLIFVEKFGIFIGYATLALFAFNMIGFAIFLLYGIFQKLTG